MKMRSVIVIGCVFSSFAGCAAKEAPAKPLAPEQVIIAKDPEVPAGVVRYCWQEPQVAYEAKGPGLDAEGKWYHPSYDAVRQVKGGEWHPCK